MRILLNTLYVTTPESYLSKDGLNVVISVDKNEIFRIPIHRDCREMPNNYATN